MNKLVIFNALKHCNKQIGPSVRSLSYLIANKHQSPSYYPKSSVSIFKSNFHSASICFNSNPNLHEQPIVGDKEKTIGTAEKHEFLADTKQLLNIVAKSLYSEKEVFIRYILTYYYLYYLYYFFVFFLFKIFFKAS